MTCLQKTNDIGQTIVHNICTGAITTVPWGSADWTGFWISITVVSFLGLVLLGYTIIGARALWEDFH